MIFVFGLLGFFNWRKRNFGLSFFWWMRFICLFFPRKNGGEFMRLWSKVGDSKRVFGF